MVYKPKYTIFLLDPQIRGTTASLSFLSRVMSQLAMESLPIYIDDLWIFINEFNDFPIVQLELVSSVAPTYPKNTSQWGISSQI